MKTKIFLLLCQMLWLSMNLFCQEKGDKPKTYQEIKKEKETDLLKRIAENGSTIEQEIQKEGSEYNDFLKWKNYWEPRMGLTGTFDDYFNAILKDHAEGRFEPQQPNRSFGNTDAWYDLGPDDKPGGLTSISGTSEPGIGPTHFITFYRPNPDKMLCCARTGGLFYSGNKGLNWSVAGSDAWNHSGCRSACFSPNDPLTWYACSMVGGTSELDFARMSIGAGGVYRTVDGGVNYNLVADMNDFTGSASTTRLHKILIDPSNAAIAYLATHVGLYKSTNVNDVTPANVTWSIVKTGDIKDIEFKPGNSNVIYAVIFDGTNYTIEHSNNQGSTWQSPIYSASAIGGITIEVTEANNDLLFFLSLNAANLHGTLYKFTYSTTTTSSALSGPWDTHFGQGNAFTVSNFNANTIYLNSNVSDIKKSTDGGLTFPTNISGGTAGTRFHDDLEYMCTPPATCTTCTNDVFICTHGGVSYSTNACSTIIARMDGLRVAEVDGLSTSQTNPEKISMGLYHDGTVLSSGVFSPTWTPTWDAVYGGDGQRPYLDQSDPNFAWASPQNSTYILSASGGGPLSYSQTVNFPAKLGAFWNYMSQNPIVPEHIYAFGISGGEHNIHRSTNRGKTTDANGNPITFDAISDFNTTHGLAVGTRLWWHHSATDKNYMYVRTSDGPVHPLFRNTDITNSSPTAIINNWETLPLPTLPAPQNPATAYMYSLAVDPTNPNIVYILYNGYWWPLNGHNIWKADYTNISSPVFTDIAGNFPHMGVGQILTEKGSNGGLYVSTDNGAVYYANNATINGSSTVWTLLGTGLPHLTIGDMEINYASNKIRAMTKGRGVWEHDLYCPSNLSLSLSGAQNTNFFFEAVNGITSTQQIGTANTVTYRAGTSIELNTGFFAASNSTNYFSAFIHPCSYAGNSPGIRDDENEWPETTDPTTEFGEDNVTIFPNPNNGQFTLSTTWDNIGDVKIYDLMGRVVYAEKNITGKTYSLNLNQQESIYLVELTDPITKKSVFKKIVIQ